MSRSDHDNQADLQDQTRSPYLDLQLLGKIAYASTRPAKSSPIRLTISPSTRLLHCCRLICQRLPWGIWKLNSGRSMSGQCIPGRGSEAEHRGAERAHVWPMPHPPCCSQALMLCRYCSLLLRCNRRRARHSRRDRHRQEFRSALRILRPPADGLHVVRRHLELDRIRTAAGHSIILFFPLIFPTSMSCIASQIIDF